MTSLRSLLCGILLAISSSASASFLNHGKTVYLIEPDLVAFDIYQKMYYVNSKTLIFVREQNMLLNVGKDLELGIQLPFINHKEEEVTFSRAGDMKFHVNIGTNWFRWFGRINYYFEYNVATGPKWIEQTTHGMESYGYQELRHGFIFFKRMRYFSLHTNFFYVFRSHEERNFFNSFFGDGVTLNPFQKPSYRRAFGFNPKNDRTYFYEGNLKNDNLEYMVGFNTDLPYPLVPFVEFTLAHDFHSEYADLYLERYGRRAPGSGYVSSQAAIGTKYFLADDHFVLKLALIFPIGELTDIHKWGAGLGVRIDF